MESYTIEQHIHIDNFIKSSYNISSLNKVAQTHRPAGCEDLFTERDICVDVLFRLKTKRVGVGRIINIYIKLKVRLFICSNILKLSTQYFFNDYIFQKPTRHYIIFCYSKPRMNYQNLKTSLIL